VNEHQAERIVEAADRIAHLPAIPTHDWCDRAAAATADSLFSAQTPGIIAVGIGHAHGDRIDRLETVGVAGVGIEDSRDLIEKLDGLVQFPAGVNGSLGSNGHSLAMSGRAELRESSNWKNSAIAKLLTSRGLSAFLIGAGLIVDSDPNRVLWVLGAAEDNAPYIGDMMFVMVVLMALLRRARLAMADVGRDMRDWISPREQEILNDLVVGKSVRQIAEETGRSPHTIHDHVKSLHRKLNATSRGELIARALGHVTQATRIRESSRRLRR
jgi:DNA-binding CsgD family transcriptional regulator